MSVCVVTYNQVAYIRACLQSIADQKTNFPFEVIVGDDCSTDDTAAVVREFAARYPGKFIAVRHSSNLGPYANYRHIHRMARGEYVAHLDGDDFALPGKLTRQAELLDTAPECSAVFHKLKVIEGAGRETGRLWPTCAPEQFDLSFLLQHHPIVGHSSMMYRNGLLRDFLGDHSEFVDFMVYVHLALQGRFACIDELLGGYRAGVGISASTKWDWLDLTLKPIEFAEKHGVASKTIRKAEANQMLRSAYQALLVGKFTSFRMNIERSVSAAIISFNQMFLYAFRREPRALIGCVRLYKALRSRGFVRDQAMIFK